MFNPDRFDMLSPCRQTLDLADNSSNTMRALVAMLDATSGKSSNAHIMRTKERQ